MIHLVQHFPFYQDYLADLLTLCFQEDQPILFVQEFHQFREDLLALDRLSDLGDLNRKTT